MSTCYPSSTGLYTEKKRGEFGVWKKEGGAEALCVRSTPSRGIRGHAPPGKFCGIHIYTSASLLQQSS